MNEHLNIKNSVVLERECRKGKVIKNRYCFRLLLLLFSGFSPG